MEDPASQDLVATLATLLGADRVLTDPATRALFSSDLYAEGPACAGVIRPRDAATLAAAVAAITAAGHAVLPRGGGLSYTGGYIADTGRAVVVDTRDLAGIHELDAGGMTVTVGSGTT